MPTSSQVTGRQIDVNGARLYVEERGQGEPLVLVQPGLVSSAVYAGLATLLAERFHVITFDARGHGRSTNPSGALTYELLTEDTALLIEALQLERPFVGGWSDGGQVALEIGLRHPGLARALFIGAASLDLQSDAAHAMVRAFFQVQPDGTVDFEALAAGPAGQMLPMLRRLHPHGEQHWQEVLQRSATMWLSYGGLTPQQVAGIPVPALVVLGDRDEVIPIDMGVQIFRSLSHAELAILPGADHMQPIFDPSLLAHVLSAYLARH